jgi:hypothetical protein
MSASAVRAGKTFVEISANDTDFQRGFFHFVWNIRHTHHHALVVPANVQHTALGIGKSTDPAEKFIPPGFLPFDMLRFFHTNFVLPVRSSCIMPCLRVSFFRGVVRGRRVVVCRCC